MVRVNPNSLFGGHIDIENAAVIRRVMITLEYFMIHNAIPGAYIPHGTDGGSEKAGDLALMLLSTCRIAARDTLLLETLIAFVDARYGTNDEVLVAAKKLEAGGTETALTNSNRDIVAHQSALDYFELHHYKLDTSDERLEALRHRAPGAFWNQTIYSFSAVDQVQFEQQLRKLPFNASISAQVTLFKMAKNPKSTAASKTIVEQMVIGGGSGERAGKDKGKNKQVQPVYHKRSQSGHDPHGTQVKKVQPGQKHSNELRSDEDSVLSDPPSDIESLYGTEERGEKKEAAENEPEDETEDEPEDESSSDDNSDDDSSDGSWDRGPLLKPNTPFTRPGERVANADSINRRPAKVGHKKMRKARIKFLLERDDPTKPGKVLYRKATWYHQGTVDWSDLASVRKLNGRRGQLFKRLLGPARAPRLIWTESEMFAVFEILQEHLVEIGGRYSRIDWNVVATQLDERFHGTVFQAGEPTASRKYKVNGVTTTSTTGTLKKAVPFEPRSGHAIRSQLGAFTHPTAQEILAHARAEDGKAKNQDSDTEESFHGAESGSEDDNHYGKGRVRGTSGKIKGSKRGEGGSSSKTDKGGGSATYMRKETKEAERESAIAAAAEEERQMAILTHPRTIARDRLGARWPRGG